jgi:hypothetical protein
MEEPHALNPNWFEPYDEKSVVFLNEPVVLDDLLLGMSERCDLEMIIAGDTLSNGGHNVRVVFRPKFNIRLQIVAETLYDNRFEMRTNGCVDSSDRTYSRVFGSIEDFSQDRIMMCLRSPWSVFRWAFQPFWNRLSQSDPSPAISSELNAFLLEKTKDFEVAYRKLSSQTIRFVYRKSLSWAFDKLAKDASIMTLRDDVNTVPRSLAEFRDSYIIRQSWGTCDGWRLKYLSQK